jgi:Protein of unknown function (DUF3592)
MISSEIPWFFSTIFPWPFVLAGGGMVYDGLRELKRAHGSHRWQTTEGKVVASFVKKREADEESTESYSAEIKYQFIVDGNLKSSNRLGLADINDGRKAIAEAIVQKYSEDSLVQVFLSPHDPDVAVLEPGVCWPHISALLIGMFFLSAGGTMLWAFGWWT